MIDKAQIALIICVQNDKRMLTFGKKAKELQVVPHVAFRHGDFIHGKPLNVDLEGVCCATTMRIELRKLINDTTP